MHDPIAEKDCVHTFRRTLSPQDRTCHWFSEYCVQYNSYGLKQARTKMRLFRVGANFYETFTEKHSASLPRRFPFFLVLIPKKNAWTFRCLLLKLGLHAREDNSDMFGFVVLGDGAHWLDRMTFFFFLKKPWLLFLFLPRAIWRKWTWSGCDKFQRRWRRRSTSCSHAILRKRKNISR